MVLVTSQDGLSGSLGPRDHYACAADPVSMLSIGGR
jgi:hypothetical protein